MSAPPLPLLTDAASVPPKKPKKKKKKQKPMTNAEIEAAIQRSPKHKHIVKLYRIIFGLSLIPAVLVLVTVGTSVGFGSGVLKEHAWFIFHYTGTAVMSVLGVLFAGWFGYDCEQLEDPGQLIIDIWRIMLANIVSCFFLVYIFVKLKIYADFDTFSAGCEEECESKLIWVVSSPIICLFVIILISIVQLWLCLLLYHNPVLNPPPEKLKAIAATGAAEAQQADEEKVPILRGGAGGGGGQQQFELEKSRRSERGSRNGRSERSLGKRREVEEV